MPSHEGIKVVFGGAGINPGSEAFGSAEKVKKAIDLLLKGGCSTIDTAQLYGESERILGEAAAHQHVTIDTKTRGGFNSEGKGGSKDIILAEAKSSKEKLGTNVDILYIHAPDLNTDFEETAAAINEVHKTGFFKRFGLSNYKASDVQKMHDIAKKNGYVLPTVYQGNYSAIARLQEELLFPTLRKLDMAFYAYSPLAGGFLTKDKDEIAKGSGRFNSGHAISGMYSEMYSKPSFIEALADWESIAKEEGCTKADLAYRWVRYNSPLKPENGDAIIIGARTVEQLEQTLSSINGGPLSDKAVKGIDAIWQKIEKDAPLDNFHRNQIAR